MITLRRDSEIHGVDGRARSPRELILVAAPMRFTPTGIRTRLAGR
ncbi:MAG TPA: hypothetical protein VHK06_07880 [Candidatus Limnocylindria bacterium]|nr:hypothetical protein [Candidatus Limnocylindria bacterium]